MIAPLPLTVASSHYIDADTDRWTRSAQQQSIARRGLSHPSSRNAALTAESKAWDEKARSLFRQSLVEHHGPAPSIVLAKPRASALTFPPKSAIMMQLRCRATGYTRQGGTVVAPTGRR
jgi:hypothetical protein